MAPRPRTSLLLPALAVLACAPACAPPGGGRELSGGSLGLATGDLTTTTTTTGDPADTDATPSTGDDATTTSSTTTDASTTTEPTTTTTTGDLPPAIPCELRSTTHGAGLQELMVAKGSPEQLVFTVPGLPEPALVAAATLRFTGYDVDHPGEEGVIIVNGGPPIDLPADAADDNAERLIEVDISGRTIAGDNTIAFGAGSFDGGTFYRIGALAIDAMLHLEACPGDEDLPDGPAQPVQLGFNDATYTERHNWVLRCDFQDGYAFTAKGDEQIGLDCGDLYAPDGSRSGTAIFTFEDLPKATYRVSIKSRHTVNRNPKGALFIVDGEGKRVNQRDDQDFVVDVWGDKELAGTVDVVLDSTNENESDSVTWVRLEPV